MYPAEEVQKAVERLVRGSIRRPLDTLGTRRTDIAFSDIQEAGATVLLLDSGGPFYCLALGAQRLRDLVAVEVGILDALLDAVAATGRRASPIESVDMLFGAKAALEELETAAVSRTQGFKDISKVPSYQRFAANVASFLDGPAQNVKANGEVVQTSEQARQAIPGLLRQLAEQHAVLTERAAKLAAGIDNFKAVNLPALVASGAISRARQVLGAHAETLESLSKEERLLKVRDVTLDVLATKAVVTQFGSFTGPTAYHRILGTGQPYADVAHPASPAAVTSTTLDALSILPGQTDFLIQSDDGAGGVTSLNLEAPPSITAAVSSSLFEVLVATAISSQGWLIGDGTNPAPPPGATVPDNNELRIQVGPTVYPVSLVVSADFTTFVSAQEICDEINAQVPGGILLARPIFSPLEYSGPLDVGVGGTFTVPGGATDFVRLGVKVGHLVEIAVGVNAGLYPIVSFTTTTLTVSGVFVAELGANAEVGPPLRKIRIALADPATQVPAQTKLSILGDTDKSAAACSTLGFFPGIYSQSLRTTIVDLVEQLNGRTNKVVASAVYSPVVSSDARSDALNAKSVTFFKATGVAEVFWSGVAATLLGSFDLTKIAKDDVLVLRSGPNPGAFGVVDSATSNQVRVVMGAPGVAAAGVAFESGIPIVAAEYMTVRIDDGPNRGDYLVEGQGATPLDVVLKGLLPQSRQGIDPLVFSASVGHKALVLSGKSTGLSAELSVSGTGAPVLFSVVPAVAYGRTRYFQLPEVPRSLQAGDVLELYDGAYNVPTTAHVIELVESSLRLVRVTPELSTHLSPAPPERWVFADQVPPFARVRVTQTFDFTTFQERALAWLARTENQQSYFSEVSRFLNPLLVNTSPTVNQVEVAKSIILPLYQLLSASAAPDPTLTLEYALASYQVAPVPAVDTLLKSYKEKGSDRAVDLLLEGQFGAFFGLSLDEASYAGAMQAAMRDVAREDIVVTKVGRVEAPRQLSQADSPDYDYDSSDIERGSEVDPPET